MKIAVDAMGGDFAPAMVVRGAVQAALESGVSVTLVGDAQAIRRELDEGKAEGAVDVCHCTEVIQMDEAPFKAVRQKRKASIRVAFDLVRQGQVDAVVSAGNSGATMAAGLLTLGKVRGVDRPALASIFPGRHGEVILIDVGANVDCRPLHLLQFGIMAEAFATSCMGMQDPRIGLLSIGEEGAKGNEQVRAAYELFKGSRLHFVGNVEGRDLFSGKTEIVVCDGFVGNVALKVSEGMAEAMGSMVREEMSRTVWGRLGLFLGRNGFLRLRRTLDYESYGGAPILGINGIGIVCHGRSSDRALKNAVKRAAEYVKNDFQGKLARRMETFASGLVRAS